MNVAFLVMNYTASNVNGLADYSSLLTTHTFKGAI